jgi:hypothetical protein
MKYITVCKNTILSNLKHSRNDPTIRVSDGKYGRPRRVHTFESTGRVKVVCDMEHPLPWGARVWLEIEE